ncbi:hypothetical protein [Sediminibacterium sp.]|uniref:hypothetical protein n=1 Tax=Sediminibacterium sp. TaxID=1917865 RepID=UPI0027309C77|nr:hypothetical protein [Sediminibacterium sp.]MDP2421347.1 hypothetical protein [Sediminibacterium sp.]
MKAKYYLTGLIFGLILLSPKLFAQKDSSGIYKTAEDFQQRKLSYAINCKTEKHRINPNVLFKGSEVKIKHMGTTYIFKKSEVFGYRACDGKEYKFVNNNEYTILNPGEPLILYFFQHTAHSPKTARDYPPMYYFSKDATSPLKELTKTNLKAAFPDNHKFHDELDSNFKDDKELFAYDNFHKMSKLNWLLKNYKN